MKQMFFILMAAMMLAACGNNSPKTDDKCCDGKDTVKNGCQHPENMVMLDSLLANQDEYVDKEIAVCGIATHVCMHSGKNLFVAVNEDDEDYLVAKANDELGVFDQELTGKHVLVTGTYRKVEEEAVETHHEKEVFYYLEASKVEVRNCDGKNHGACKGDKGKAGCCKGHADKKEGSKD